MMSNFTVNFSVHIGKDTQTVIENLPGNLASRRSAVAQKQLSQNGVWRTRQGMSSQTPRIEMVIIQAADLALVRKPKQALPTKATFDLLSEWMRSAPRREDHLPALMPAFGRRNNLEDLVNMYAAATLLGVRPFPKPLKQRLLNKINERPLYTNEIRSIWLKLPAQEEIIRVLVRAYRRHLEGGRLGPEQDKEIWTLIDAEPELALRFDKYWW